MVEKKEIKKKCSINKKNTPGSTSCMSSTKAYFPAPRVGKTSLCFNAE